MNIISQRNLQPPVRGKINFAGFIDPQGISYPVNNETHAQWILEHVDWLLSKGYKLPSSVDIMGEIAKHETANVRNILVEQGWLAVQTPCRWHVRDIAGQGRQIEDAIHAKNVAIRPEDFPIEVFELGTSKFIRVYKEDFDEHGISENLTRPQILSWFRRKSGFTKEALRNVQENVVMFREVIRNVDGEMQHWITADASDLDTEPDVNMKFRLALVEAGMHADGHFYDKRLNSDYPNQEYKEVVQKVTDAFKQMLGPDVGVVLEKEWGRDDRSAIYITQKREVNDFMQR